MRDMTRRCRRRRRARLALSRARSPSESHSNRPPPPPEGLEAGGVTGGVTAALLTVRFTAIASLELLLSLEEVTRTETDWDPAVSALSDRFGGFAVVFG